MRNKTVKYVAIAIIGFLFIWSCEEFFRRKIGGWAGSYPFVETWNFNATEVEVLSAIVELKTAHPELQPPRQERLFWPRSAEPNDYWLHIEFYYPDTKEIVYTWTRPEFDTLNTTFAFVSLGSIARGENKMINRDFWYLANKHQIKKFKTTFVDRIQAKIDEKKLNRSTR